MAGEISQIFFTNSYLQTAIYKQLSTNSYLQTAIYKQLSTNILATGESNNLTQLLANKFQA